MVRFFGLLLSSVNQGDDDLGEFGRKDSGDEADQKT
jgi:hypothetical protein